MTTTKKLQAEYEKAQEQAYKIQAQRDEAMDAVREKWDAKLRDANDDAAAKQKAWQDAEATDALRDRPDGEAVADALGLSLDD